MEKLKRLIAALALLTILTSVFASCKSTPDDNGDGGTEDGGGLNGGGTEDGGKDEELGPDTGNDILDDDPSFDYVLSDLREYIDFSEDDYKGYSVTLQISRPRDYDVDVAILNLVASFKGEAKNDGNAVTESVTVMPGDTVNIWYRGYILGENGEELAMNSMSNFAGEKASPLSIGSGQFVPGFEMNLVGAVTGEHPKFEKITEGEIKETQIAYVSYSRTDSSGKTAAISHERIELSDTDIDATYGAGFRAQLLLLGFGDKVSFNASIGDESYGYNDLTVNFVTECEADPLVVECYFPYDYGTEALRNQTAYFEVYIESVVQYECPVFDDDFVLEYVNGNSASLTYDELMTYEGETLTERFRAYVIELIYTDYEEKYETLFENEMWEHYLSKAVVKKYPAVKVMEIYNEYVADVEYQYKNNGGELYDQYTGSYVKYETLEEFAVAYLGLRYSADKDWRTRLYNMAKNLVKERLILYYLIQVEDIAPTDVEFSAIVESIKQEYIEEYIKRYLEYQGMTREDFTDEAFEQFVEERKTELFEYYGLDYFTETAYYETAFKEFIKWADITILGEE